MKRINQKVQQYFCRFCIFMLICGVISRGIYAYRLPEVKVAGVEKKTISHTVKADGIIQSDMEIPIYTLADLKIAQVYVTQGQQVKEGDALFALDLNSIQEKLAEQQKEAQSLQLQIQAATTNEAIAESFTQKEKERAEKDYLSTVTEGERQILDAADDLTKAQQKQQEFATQAAYVEREKAKDTQLQAYKNSKEQNKEKKEDAEEAEEKAKKKLTELQKELEEYKENSKDIDETERTEHIASLEESILQQKNEVTDAKKDADEKKDAYENAKDDLETYEASLELTLKDAWQKEKDALEETVGDKTDAYQTTITEQQKQAQNAQRDVENKEQPQTTDNLIEVNQLSLAQMQETMEKYQTLLDENGLITTSNAGMIHKLQVETGNLTSQEAAVVIAQNGEELDFVADITKDDKKYLTVGDPVTVSFDEGRIEYRDCNIYAIEESSAGEGYQVHVKVPRSEITLHQTGTMQLVKQSRIYDTCVPLQSMMAEGTQYYCMILVEKTGFMGQEYAVEKKPVVMADHNDTYAALEDHTLDAEQKVIIYGDHVLHEGDIVRLSE